MSVFYFDGVALFRPWSVRTYNFVRRANVSLETAEQVADFAEDALRGVYPHATRRIVVELFRGAGYGVHTIHNKMGDIMPLDAIRELCNGFDIMFHDPMD